MRTINITNARQNLFKFTLVLIEKDEWINIEETLYLSSIPGFVDDVNNIRNNEKWEDAKEYNPNEEW